MICVLVSREKLYEEHLVFHHTFMLLWSVDTWRFLISHLSKLWLILPITSIQASLIGLSKTTTLCLVLVGATLD